MKRDPDKGAKAARRSAKAEGWDEVDYDIDTAAPNAAAEAERKALVAMQRRADKASRGRTNRLEAHGEKVGRMPGITTRRKLAAVRPLGEYSDDFSDDFDI